MASKEKEILVEKLNALANECEKNKQYAVASVLIALVGMLLSKHENDFAEDVSFLVKNKYMPIVANDLIRKSAQLN